MLHAWASWAGDPAAPAARWITEGAPAGIAVNFELDGLLEPVAGEECGGVDDLASDPDTFANYAGVEDDPAALAILDDYISKGWLESFTSIENLRAAVGGEPILNKFACVVKTRIDGTLKHRIIMDSKESQVTSVSRKSYKAVLPRFTDLVQDCLNLQCGTSPIECFVCDAEDAFWHRAILRFGFPPLRSTVGTRRSYPGVSLPPPPLWRAKSDFDPLTPPL